MARPWAVSGGPRRRRPDQTVAAQPAGIAQAGQSSLQEPVRGRGVHRLFFTRLVEKRCRNCGLLIIQRKVAAFAGTTKVVSPSGGPTVIRGVIPLD